MKRKPCSACQKPISRHNAYQKEECKFVRKYIRQTQVGPFPVQFITVDPVIFFGDNVLLVRRKNHPGKGKLALPGGFVNHNETILSACLRECYEETGLFMKELWHLFNKVYDDPKRSPGVRIVTHAHVFDLPIGFTQKPKAADDAAWCGWVPVKEALAQTLHDDHAKIIKESFLKIRRKL